MDYLFFCLVFIFGAIIGSFLNVVILRLPKDESLGGRSHCVFCLHDLQTLDLIPILSFLFLKGKCRYCKRKISSRYFIIEFITGVLFVWAYYILRPALNFYDAIFMFQWWLLISVCLVTFVVDFEHYIILFYVVVPSAILSVLCKLFLDIAGRHSLFSSFSLFVSSILGMFAGLVLFLLLWYASKWRTGETGRWMGFGDVELAACLGAMLGWPNVLVGIFIGILSGGIVGLIFLATGAKTLKSKLPFGVFLSLGSVMALFYGAAILSWYLSLIGVAG